MYILYYCVTHLGWVPGCVALLMPALITLLAFFLPPTNVSQQHPGDAANMAFFNLGGLCGYTIALFTVWDSFFFFFLWFDENRVQSHQRISPGE